MKKDKGFTLLEMLIIVGILAVLIAIGYPYFSGIFEKNRENADITAMQSAKALLETAYDTGLNIEGKGTVKDTKATKPLYYDAGGKLTWTPPEPYGQGTAGNSGITWSCCDDYEYDPAKSYAGGYIYCYYNATDSNIAYPGLHVHWSIDGYNGNVPTVTPPPTQPTFPTRPGQEEETTEPTTATTEESKPTGSGDTEETPSHLHKFPGLGQYGSLNGRIDRGCRYYDDDSKQVYVAVLELEQGANRGQSFSLKTGYAFVPLKEPYSDENRAYPQIFTSSKNLTVSGKVVKDNTLPNPDNDSDNGTVNIKCGDYFVLEAADPAQNRYFVYKEEFTISQEGPEKSANWVEVKMCSLCKKTSVYDLWKYD